LKERKKIFRTNRTKRRRKKKRIRKRNFIATSDFEVLVAGNLTKWLRRRRLAIAKDRKDGRRKIFVKKVAVTRKKFYSTSFPFPFLLLLSHV